MDKPSLHDIKWIIEYWNSHNLQLDTSKISFLEKGYKWLVCYDITGVLVQLGELSKRTVK